MKWRNLRIQSWQPQLNHGFVTVTTVPNHKYKYIFNKQHGYFTFTIG